MADALHTPGVVDAKEARLDDGGLLALQGPGVLDVRTGVLIGPGTTQLVTGTSATSPMTVQVAAHHWVTTRGAAFGPYRGTAEAVKTVSIAAAPGSGSRIDVVYVKQQDNTSGIPSPDASIGELYAVAQGTPSTGTPAKPSLPVGAEELATVQVSAGATSTNGSGVTITNTARQTVARGGVLPVADTAERTALSDAGGAHVGLVVAERSTGRLYLYVGGATGWAYIGGNPPPVVTATVASGWTAFAGHAPGCYKDASGLVKIVGCVLNTSIYNPQTGTGAIVTLPSGYRPAEVATYPITTGGGAGTMVYVTVGTDGTVKIVGGLTNSIGASNGHWLSSIPAFHPAYAGTVPLG